ncbi:dihydroneopterin aldolase [Compostibacter hankyongensis]|uniref:Dihydroneopterin aldolase n=1 Tax=Compostibacter hankyongensis TaxID=1007089 RepID=A0ABP8G793_9BACT
MLTVSLNGIRFHAFHGMYPGEERTGTDFIVDVAVSCPEPGDIRDLTQTVDYEVVYQLVEARMGRPVKLIEELAQDCVEAIHQRFDFARIIEISIRKMYPPLGGEVECSRVVLKREFV